MAQFNENIILKSGAYVKNLKISTELDTESIIAGVFKAVTDGNDITDIQVCSNGIDWFSLRGYKAENMASEADGRVPIYEGLTADGKNFQFRVLKAGQETGESSPSLSISQSSGVITIDLSAGTKEELAKIKNKVEKEFKTGSITDYKVLSDNNFSDALKARLETIQIKEDPLNAGQYILVYHNGTNDVKLGENIDITAAIVSGSVKECDTIDEPVIGYKIGDKYIDFVLAGGEEHVYILVSDLIDVMQGYEGDEIKTIVDGQTVKAELLNDSVVMARLKAIAADTIGEITPTDTQIANNTAIRIENAVRLFAANIAYLFTNKANKLQSIATIEASSTQLSTPNPTQDIALDIILQKALNNIKYLFDNKANSDHLHEGVYLKPADIIDNISDSSTTKPLSANQGKVLGGLINERIKGVRVDGVELPPDPNKIVEVPIMQGATPSLNGKAGLVPKPLSGQQSAFLRGDGSYGVPNADVVASASYIGATTPVLNGMTSCTVVGDNVEILLTNAYVSRALFPAAVDIVRVMRNGLDLVEGEDFTIETLEADTRKKIILVNYPLHTDTDIIIVKYKTSIGVYGSIFQTSLEECIEATSEAITASERAENAAIEAENIADSKIDKSAITGVFGQDATKVISQKGFTDNISEILQLEGEELWAYGVKWNQGQESATLERIGNMNMHRTLPCHKTRGCLVKDDGSINYYLYDSSDFLKEDGVTPSVLDGTDGDVMNFRKFYYRTAIKDGIHVNWMSPYPLPGYTLYENLTGRYKASINRTTGKIHSVINNSPEYRGGNNSAAWDSDGRSLLGCAVSAINRAAFRTGARNGRSVDWNGSPEHDDFFARLIYARIKWATHNFQLPFNPALDANGYHQGGMGSGTTNLNSTKWNGFNNYNPFIPCGYTAEFGNGSGVKDFVMPFEYDGYNTTLSQQKYVGVYDSERAYAVGEYVSDSYDTYKGSGDALLYICIMDAPAGTLLTNTTYFSVVNRTVTQAIRMDGEEQWFGEIWEHYANVIIEHNADVEPKTSKAYIFHKPSEITETRTGNEEFLCDLPISDGYIREFNSNSIFPISTGGGSTTYGCDYYYCNYPASGIASRGCLGGGAANNSSTAGPSCSASNDSPSNSDASIGGRLVLKSKNRVIIDK